ncbi:MAG: 5-(carboxyamino)imidazole ribonucleotide synthase [Chitinophagales bacterium]
MKNKPVIGVIGGGQLGRMFIEEALRYNIECIIVDADKDCPASVIAHDHIVGSIAEAGPIRRLGEVADVLTYEIEHIFTEPLFQLQKEGKTLIPSPQILKIVQDKGLQKQFYADHKIPTAKFQLVNNETEWAAVIKSFRWKKFVAKSRKEGYDGRGVQVMQATDVIVDGKIPFNVPAVLEAFIECKKEVSIIVARDQKGNLNCFPPVEMEFDPVANLVTMLVCPATLKKKQLDKANKIAMKVVECMSGVGIFAIELFLDHNDKWFVNEMAPRPHNSGHHTIEACYTSQYEQLLRILLDLPLGSTDIIKPAVMINILGASDFSGPYYFSGYDDILKIPGVYVHLYGKKVSRPMRKLGHITILGNTVNDAKQKAKLVRQHFSIRKWERKAEQDV